jgi:hypothetical protein
VPTVPTVPTLTLPQLSQIRIATPCSMRWDDMAGDDKKRFCEACGLHVHNLDAMSPEEVGALFDGGSERVCGRLRRRADGTILERDCPVGLRALRHRAAITAGRIAAAVAFLITGSVLWAARQREPWKRARVESLQPFAAVAEWIDPAVAPPPVLMGMVSISPATPQQIQARARARQLLKSVIEDPHHDTAPVLDADSASAEQADGPGDQP